MERERERFKNLVHEIVGAGSGESEVCMTGQQAGNSGSVPVLQS